MAGGPGFGISNYGGNSKGANDSLASGMDIAINSSLLTDFRLGYYRYNVIDSKYSTAELANTWGIPGINTGNPFTAGAPGFIIHFPFTGNQSTFGAGLGINRCNCPLTEREDQFQIVNNWTKVLGQPLCEDRRGPALRPQPARAVGYGSCRPDGFRRRSYIR